MSGTQTIFVGVLRMALSIPGARSRKDRRQAVRSLADRMRHRFKVTVNEVDRGDHPSRAVLVCTTAGNDGRPIRVLLDQCSGMARSHGSVGVTGIDVDVFRWHSKGGLDLETFLESDDG